MVCISLRGVGKRYRIFYEKSALVSSIMAKITGKTICEDLWALKDINLDIEKGETVGVIGKNGSGKTTLLKLLCGVTRHEEGNMDVEGKVSTLLELGIGFQGELTGRENAYLNASILGLTPEEIKKRYEEIVNFAGLERFMDAKLQTYSSGMNMRLGFSVAVHADFDILLVDEVLAVGDISYQQRCFAKFEELKRRGITILFVSHDLNRINQVCNRTIWLEKGRLKKFGISDEVTRAYLEWVESNGGVASEDSGMAVENTQLKSTGKRWGSREIEITDVTLSDGKGCKSTIFETGKPWSVIVHYQAKKRRKNPVFGIGIYSEDGTHICGPNTKAYACNLDYVEGKGKLEFSLDSLPLLEGNYLLSASVYDYDIKHSYDHHDRLYRFEVKKNKMEERYGFIKFPGNWRVNTSV